MNTPIAVALEYDGKTAPKITAKGIHSLAEEILEIAREHDIPISQEKALVEILAQLELGQEIPESLYRVVAEIIAFVYMLAGKFPQDFNSDKT